jgi:hypothetical protein
LKNGDQERQSQGSGKADRAIEGLMACPLGATSDASAARRTGRGIREGTKKANRDKTDAKADGGDRL